MNRIAKLNEDERLKFTTIYNTICNYIFTEDRFYKTPEILSKLQELDFEFNDRTWRNVVENIMNLFIYGYLDKMVVGLNNGYKLTNDVEDIRMLLQKKRKQFISLAVNYNELAKAMGKRNNITFDMINWGEDNNGNN